MKKALLLSFQLTILLSSFSQWQQLGSSNLTSTVTDNLSLDVDNSGTLYCSYKPFSDNLLYVKKYVQGNWEQVGSSASLEPIGEGNMVVGIDGLPVVVYRNYNDSIVVRKFNGNDWQTVGNGPFAKGDYPRIEVNEANMIHVVFNNKAVFPWGTSVYKFEGGNWVPVHAMYVENLQSSFTDIAFDSNDLPIVSFRRESTGQMSVFRSNGSNWEPYGNILFTPENVFFCRLVLDNNDVPYVTFSESGLDNAGSVMSLNGSSWQYVDVPGFTIDAIDYAPMVFNTENIPHIAYQNGSSTKLMRYNGLVWEQVDLSPGFGGDHDLIFNQFGNPVLAMTLINQNYNLTVQQLCSSITVDQEATICDGEVFEIGGQEFSESGSYQVTLTRASGCDSIVNFSLIALPPVLNNQTATICSGESFQVGNVTYTESGIYTNVLESSLGCDSSVITSLTVLDAIESTQNVQLCFGETISIGSSTYDQTGIYSDVFTAVNGCDSLVITIVTVNAPINSSVTVNELELTANQNGAIYQWIDCSSMVDILGQDQQVYSVTETGEYAVDITFDGCTVTSECISIEVVGLSEEELDFKIFPNPVLDECNIVGATYDEVIVLDVSGRQLIHFWKDNLIHHAIDLGQLESGKYILKIMNEGILQGRMTILKN
jgi:hypothetical protein